MCGIFGLTTIESSNYSRCFIENTINQLFLLSESRGKDASGVVFYSEQQLSHYESPVPASRFVKTKNYNELLGSLLKNSMASKKNIIDRRLSIMGHTRLATNGDAGNINNNQPVIMEKIVGIHNGIVVNSYNMHDLFSLPSKKGVSDSETIFLLLDLFIKQGLSIQESMRKIYQNIEGSASIVVLIPHKKTLLLGTNTGSLYLCKNKAKNICIFASELPILKKLIKKIKLQDLIGECFVEQIVAGSGIELSLNDLSEKRFSLEIDFSEAKEKE